MAEKTHGDVKLHKTWKKTIFIALLIFGAIILSAVTPASAEGTPTSLLLFTDKKTYMGWWVKPVKNGVGYSYAGVDTAPLEMYVYAMVLNEKGLILKGKEGQLSGFVADYKRLSPGQASGHHIEHFGETIFGSQTLTFVDDGSLPGDEAGDGIYVAKVTLDKTKGSTLIGDHEVMNVTVSFPGLSTQTQQVLISGFYCMNGAQSGKGHGTHTSQTGTSADCAVCHHGYEHWYENVSGTFSDDQLDIHALKVNAPDIPASQQPTTTLFDSNRWNYSDDGGSNNLPNFEQQVTGSKYCAFCHEVNGVATFDYGAGDRTNMSDRPSCNNSNCHHNATTEISQTAVPAWQPGTMPSVASSVTRAAYNITVAQQHAHDSNGVSTVPCVSCHRTTHSVQLPNRTSTDYTDLANRCLSCHTLFNKHNSTVSCIKCHTNDTHNIRFLQQDLSYNWSKANIVECDNCHTNISFAGSLNLNPPQVPYTNHSEDLNSGQKWGDYWTSKSQPTIGANNLISSSNINVTSESVGTAGTTTGVAVSIGDNKIAIIDSNKNSLTTNINTFDEAKTLKKKKENADTLSVSDISEKGEIEVDALSDKNVAVKLKIEKTSGGKVILDNFGKKNPVSVPLPEKAVKYVEIGASGISFSSAEIRIKYSDDELEGAEERTLVIYHWNGAAWEALATKVDTVNNILSATTTSLSPFGVSTGYGYLNAMVARKVILDEPWGNYGAGNDWNPDGGTAAANWENGISVTQFVYLVLISKYGFPIQGATVTGYYTAANGSTNLFPFSGITDAYGEFNKSTSLDNQVRIGQTSNAMGPNEGIWNVTINVTYNGTTNSVKRDFILGEYGCGRSATSCHQPAGSIAPKGSAMNPQPLLSQDPYIQGVQVGGAESTHIVYAGKTPDQTEHEGQILGLTAYPGITRGTSCLTCHRGYNQSGYDATIGYKDTGVVLTSTGDIHDVNGVKCKDCHQNITYGGYEQRRYGVPQCYNSSCHANTINIPKKWIQSKNNSYSWNQHAHDTNQTIACIFCHGPYHNISKPNTTFYDPPANGVTESEMCLNNCHKNQQYHNGTLQCTVCHSQAAHEIRFFNSTGDYTYNTTESLGGWNVGKAYAGKCSTCHQKPYFANLLNHTRNTTLVVNGSYSNGADGSKQVSNPLTHSNALNNGTKWGNYWNTSNDSDPCLYCHGIVYNNVGYSFTWDALGHVWKFKGNNTVNSSISGNTYWCASCHWQFYNSGGKTYTDMVNSFLSDNDTVPPEITGNATYGANTSKPGYRDHSGESKDDATCKGCHGGRIAGLVSPTITDFMHNVSIGAAGGANCTNCHNIGGSAGTGRLLNLSAMNDTNAIHRNLNSGATTALPPENKKCWACHGDGSEPASGHPSRYKTPYNCTDCHISAAGQNLNFTPNNTILNVTQHYWNGSNITTSGVTSCYSCHNRTEMMLGTNLDPDGAASVYGGANGGNNSSSHYGRKRTDMAVMDNYTYCSYCHNATTNNATFYVSDFNNTIYNHTSRATTPLCGACHNNGRIHDNTLVKPVSNDTLCKTCHGTGGSALTNNKSEHKTLYCTECHSNSSTGTLAGKDIHGVKYLTQINSFATSNSSAMNCTTCHQGSVVDSSISGFTPYKISNPLHHSDNVFNGSIWGSYWVNTSPITACIYCHSSTLHNATPLGRILQWAPNYVMYAGIGTNTSCANCHYKGDSNYTAMSSAFNSQTLPVPPEITNGTSWNGRSSNYYNHSFSTYTDQDCKSCHGSQLSTQTNMSEFQHTVAVGGGGPNCIICHDIAGTGAPNNRRINASAMKLGSMHRNLNSNAVNTTSLDQINKACWACHGDGTQPARHPANYLNPKPCEYCHVAGNFNATPVYQHYPGSMFSMSVAYDSTNSNRTCVACHNNSQMANQNLTYGSYDATKLKNATVSHYAVNRSFGESMPAAVTGILPNTRNTTGTNFGCNKCHDGSATGLDYGNARNIPSGHNMMGSTGISCQSSCHNSNPQVNMTLHDNKIGLYLNAGGCYSLGCHMQPSTGGRRKR